MTNLIENQSSETLVYGHGITDISTLDNEGGTLKAYSQWKQMLARCYSDYVHNLRPNYIGCSIVAEWCTFSVFKEWFDENYFEGGCIDKDMLIAGNKIYGPQTCVMIPNYINTMLGFKKSNTTGFPGVSYDKKSGKYKSTIWVNGKSKHLGSFEIAAEAFRVYKKEKELNIKKTAIMAYELNHINMDVLESLLKYTFEV